MTREAAFSKNTTPGAQQPNETLCALIALLAQQAARELMAESQDRKENPPDAPPDPEKD